MKRCLCGGALGMALGFAWQAVMVTKEVAVKPVPETGTALKLMRESSALDPNSVWSIQLLGNEVNYVGMLYALAEVDTKADQLVARLLSLKEIQDWTLRNSARLALLEPLIDSDPQGTFERCLTLNDAGLRQQVLSEIARGWAEKDHEAALAFLDTQKSDPLYDELLLSAVSGYGKKNPGEAIALAIDRGIKEDLHRLAPLFKDFASTAPEEALKAAQTLDAGALVDETMKTWALSDPERVIRYLNESDVEISDSALRSAYEGMAKGWVERSPQDAVDWILTLTKDDLSRSDLSSVVKLTARTLSKTHPNLVAALLQSEALSSYDYDSVYAYYASGDWDGAMASLQDLKGAQKQNAITGLLDNLARRSKDEILAHLPTLLEMLGTAQAHSHDILTRLDGETMLSLVEQYPRMLENAAAGWASSNPSEAAAVIEKLPEGKARSGVVQEMIVDWAGREPDKAAAWVAGRPESTESQFAVRNLINVWGRQDSASAEAWLAAQPTSEMRDVGWQELAQLRVGFDPSASLAMSAHIADEARRHNMAAIALEGMLWQEPEAAAHQIEALALPKAIRDQLDNRAKEFAIWKRLAAKED